MVGDTKYVSHATLSGNGNSEVIDCRGNGTVHDIELFFGTGVTFGSGTIKLQYSPDAGTTWIDAPNGGAITSATASTRKGIYRAYGQYFRWNLAGATGPSLDLRTKARPVKFDQRPVGPTGSAEGSLFTANAASAPIVLPASPVSTLAPEQRSIGWAAYGTWGSGTLALQVSPDGGTTWFNLDTLTANGQKEVTGIGDVSSLYRLNLTGATSPSLTAFLFV